MFKINFFKFLFFLNIFFLSLISLYPGNLIGLIFFGDDTTFPGSDKLHHFLFYLILSVLGSLAYYEFFFFNKLLIFLILIGFHLELFQIWIPNRYFEFLDIFANFFGIIVGMYSFKLFKINYDKI